MIFTNIINCEGCLIDPFCKKRDHTFLKNDVFTHSAWKVNRNSKTLWDDKLEFLRKRFL